MSFASQLDHSTSELNVFFKMERHMYFQFAGSSDTQLRALLNLGELGIVGSIGLYLGTKVVCSTQK